MFCDLDITVYLVCHDDILVTLQIKKHCVLWSCIEEICTGDVTRALFGYIIFMSYVSNTFSDMREILKVNKELTSSVN